ncbi:MAG: MoaD/ThiS family protein [Sulfolobales archaeon]
MRVRVRYLGSLSIAFGREEEYSVAEDKITLRELLLEILKNKNDFSRVIYSNGAPRPGYMIFVNETDYQIEGLDQVLKDGDTITIMPISHGGA